jgi:AraC-like DNA-binding protein
MLIQDCSVHIDTVLHLGQVQPDPAWHIEDQVHAHHELVVVMQGLLRVSGGAAEIEARRGDCLLYPAGCRHSERSDASDPVEVIFLAFSGVVAGGLRCLRDRRGRCRELARWLLAEQRCAPCHQEAIAGLAGCLLLECARHEGEAGDHEIVAAVQSAIVAAPGQDWDLGSLALLAHLSPSHFCRRYRQLTGRTPMQELKRLRLAAALDLVRASELPLRAIASRCGFANEYHLSRCCRQLEGRPPSHFRGY